MKKIILITGIIFLYSICSFSQWVQMPGPKGTQVNVIRKNISTLFAGTQSKGVMRSTNNGTSWESINNGLGTDVQINDIISFGNYVFAAVASSCPNVTNIYRSSNNGSSWAVSGSGLSAYITQSFTVKGSTIWAAVFTIGGEGVYRSNDSGNSWMQVNSLMNSPRNIFSTGTALIASEYNFIYRSDDDGATWDVVEQFALTGVWGFTKTGTKLIAAAGSGIYISTDDGVSWDYTNIPEGAYSITSSGSTVFISNATVLKSTDAGTSWFSAGTGLGVGPIDGLLYDGVDVYAGTSGDSSGIYKSTNGGTSWFPSGSGLSVASTIRSLVSLGTIVFAGMQADGVYRSTDDGISWMKTGLNNDSLKHQLVLSMCVKNNLVFAGTQDGVFMSSDNGITFTRKVNGFPTGGRVGIYGLTVSGNNIICAVSTSYISSAIVGIYYSTNNGDSWIQSLLPVNATFVSSVASDGNPAVYAGVYTETFMTTGLYKSTNSGVSFISMTSSLMVDIERLAVKGSNVLAGGLFFSHYSTDAGLSWGSYFIPCGGTFTYTIKNNYIFAGNCEGMYYSTNMGVNWSDANSGFPACPRPDVEASCSNPSYLFAGTQLNGLWRIPLSFFGISGITANGTEIPSAYKLFQNYPNPFNPSTKIKFSIPSYNSSYEAGDPAQAVGLEGNVVKLVLYDMLGREVETLLNKNLTPGTYEVEWNARNYSSGIYYYKLSVGNFIDIKKMVLVK